MIDLGALDPKYRLILCDVWGVVHDGVTLNPGAAERLAQWRQQGRAVVLITNAPRTADAVERQLTRLSLPREAYDFVATSGEAGIAALIALESAVGFVGTAGDRAILEGRGVRIAEDENFTHLACTGITQARPNPEDYHADLERWAARGVMLHCLNPDRVVVRGGEMEACAGAIADIYESIGGIVAWYGKPYRPIYVHALDRANNSDPGQVLAVGDGLRTDMLGAANMGLDAIFVSGGIHAGEPFPDDFGASYGIENWSPIGVVGGLA